MSRRLVDEGFDRFGRELTQSYAREFANLTVVNHACIAADTLANRLDEILSSVDPTAPVESYEAYRLTYQLSNLDLVTSLVCAINDIREAHEFACHNAPLLLRRTALVSESRTVVIEYCRRKCAFHRARLDVLRHQIPVAVARLSLAFQMSRISSVAEANDLRNNAEFMKEMEAANGQLQAAMQIRDELREPPTLNEVYVEVMRSERGRSSEDAVR